VGIGMKDRRFQKLKDLIKTEGVYGKYDLGSVRAKIREIRAVNDKTSGMMSLLKEIDNIVLTKVVPYMQRSFSDTGTSNCGNFQRKLIANTDKRPTGTIESLLSSINNGVDSPILYHITFRYDTTRLAGHFFTLLLRPKRRPYIVQEEKNSYNLSQYVLYNLLRGIKNPLSKDPEKIRIFFEQAEEYKSVPLSIFTYLFGYVWDEKDNRVPIETIKIQATSVPNDIYNFRSMSID
jgi:hypothetical protein